MAAELRPPELARLVDYAERPRTGDWSLRSALVRYAESRPQQVSDVLELVRRIDSALAPHTKLLAREGPRVWAAVVDPGALVPGPDALPIELLRVMAILDELADALARWAQDRTGERPDDAVETAVRTVRARLDELGVEREERMRPPPRRGRGA
ncbi:MAG TPA: hypothetical protein VFV32_11330 [Acidimicrobiales bacterium]|nr:hypothetical protein [Acidimicrobiales bacterium]